MKGKGILRVAAVAALALVAAACTGGGTVANRTGERGRAGVEDQVPAVAGPGPSGLVGGLADFDSSAVLWNSYWYSRYNLGNLVMMSGLGIPFAPHMPDVRAMVQAVDQGPADGEHVVLPKNPALLAAVFAAGDPAFVQPFNGDPLDLSNWRWDPATANPRITPSATAQTVIKEIEWAKLFNNASWSGRVTDAFGAMDRFKGMVMFAGAKMQLGFALEQMRNEDGLFVSSLRYEGGKVRVEDPRVEVGDQFQILQALADAHSVLHSPEKFNGVYEDVGLHRLVNENADELFRAIAPLDPQGITEWSLGAQAITWYASTTHDSNLRDRALTLLNRWGDQLFGSEPRDVVERARAVRGLVEAGRILDFQPYLDRAGAIFGEMVTEYDLAHGYFESRTSLSNWEVGDILGALNALSRQGPDELDPDQVSTVLVGFFEAAVNRSGLQQAIPPTELEASPFEVEQVANDLFFAYPGIPTPDAAGGPYGRAAVDAAAIGFDEDAQRWEVTDARFDTAGAMHTANEQIWIFGFVDGFPTLP